MKKYLLDEEEREILKAVESGKWPMKRASKSELERYAKIARNTLRKDQRMNIRISKADLSGIKVKAAEEGVPYQTLVSSLIHKSVSGRLAAA